MKANYKKEEEIQADVQYGDIEEYCKFDNQGRVGFYRCELCSGPILGHMEVKCRALNGQRYDLNIVKSFQEWLERLQEFKKAKEKREERKEEK